MIYDANGNILRRYPTLVGDGITDDTAALQAIVNTYKHVQIPDGLIVRLTDTIEIDTAVNNFFDGGNSQFVVDGDFVAFALTGSLLSGMSADPSTLTEDIVQNESAYIFQNCKIRSDDGDAGVGISVDGCFQTVVQNNLLCELDKGIEIKNQNRNLSINGNNIYKIKSYGIHFMPGLNVHQINTNNNLISYCKYCIFADNVTNLINWSCVGNDIEVHDYNGTLQGAARCIKVYETDDGTEQTAITALTECVITGNNIQAHTDAKISLEMVGSANKVLNHITIAGNHIGNGADYSILLDHCKCVAISGNSAVSGRSPKYWVKLIDVRAIAITGNAIRSVGGLVEGDGDIVGLIAANNIAEYCSSKTTDMSNASVTGSIIKDNIFDGVVVGQ